MRRTTFAAIAIASSMVVPSCTVFDDLTYTPDAGANDASGYAKAVLADDPIAFWRFEDTSGAVVRDSSGRGSDCEYVGAVGRQRSSAHASLGKAIELDGQSKSYALCKDAPFDFAARAPFTVEAWVHPRTIDGEYRKVFSKDELEDTRDGWNLSVHAPEGLRFEMLAGGVQCSVTVAIPVGTWSHVAGVFDGTAVHLYVDGGAVHERKDCATVAMPDTPVRLLLGVQSDMSYGMFHGSIDDLAVYDRALAADRISAHRDAAR